jgi:hypothetical protein
VPAHLPAATAGRIRRAGQGRAQRADEPDREQ